MNADFLAGIVVGWAITAIVVGRVSGRGAEEPGVIQLRREVANVEQAREPVRCPDCGKRWPRAQVEAGFAHVMAGCSNRIEKRKPS